MLPVDLLSAETRKAFLQITDPKSRRRSVGRIQHASIEDLDVVQFASVLFGRMQGEEMLYPISAGSFRRRWDRIVQFLGIHNSLSLTPGCLRSGGAVYAYRSGQDLQRILWRMRIRQLQTLENYLQEVATDALLQKLHSTTRRKILLLSEIFRPSLSAFCRTHRPA